MSAHPRFLLLPLDLDCWETVPTRIRRLATVEAARLLLDRIIRRSMDGPDGWADLPPQEGARLAGGWNAWEIIRSALISADVLEQSGDSFRLTPRWERAPLERHVPRDPSVLARLSPDATIPVERQHRPFRHPGSRHTGGPPAAPRPALAVA